MKRTSKLLILISLIVFSILSLSTVSSAKVYTGTSGSITWTVDLNKSSMTVSGNGSMDNYINHEDAPYSKFLPIIKALTVEEGITSIGDCSFMYAMNLERVSLPSTLASIGNSSFEFCAKLESINIPHGVTSIGNTAFSSCRMIDSITLPDTLNHLGTYAFSECVSLTSIDIPEKLNVIENGVFTGCRSLSEISGLENVTEIRNGAFYGCNALKISDFPENIVSIAPRAFFGCASLSCLIPESTSVADGAFFGTDISFNVIWDVDGNKEISAVKQGQIPQYDGTPKKASVADGVYIFKSWDIPLLPATTPFNKYCAVYELASPIKHVSYTADENTVNTVAQLDLTSLGVDSAYILFAAYTNDGHMISCKRVTVGKEDTSAEANLALRNRSLAYVKAFIYADPSFITPLGESVTA